MTHADYFMLALCLWREARGEGRAGQVAVACVVRNRYLRDHTSPYFEVVKPWQFSSITAKGDPELSLWPAAADAQWQQCQQVAQSVCDGEIDDVTGGATLYWNPAGIKSSATFKLSDGTEVAFPQTWNAGKVAETVKVGNHIFLKEL